MKKINIKINVPDNDCAQCPYFRHTSREVSYHQDVDYYRCILFGGIDLTNKDGKFQRCVACQSCEVDE